MEIKFYLRKDKEKVSSTIYFICTDVNGEVWRYSTKEKILNSDWGRGYPKKVSKTKSTRDTIDSYKVSIKDFIKDHVKKEKRQPTKFEFSQFVEVLLNGEKTEHNNTVKYYIEDYLTDDEVFNTSSTKRLKKVHLDNFLKLIGNNKKLIDLNKGLLEGYKKKLKKEKIRDIATTNNYIKNIKAFLNWLFKREYIPVSVSQFLRRDATIEKDVIALTEEEFCPLEKADFEDVDVQDQIDIFLFGCYTSLSIGDIRKFRPEMINENDILNKRRIKNHSNQKIPLIPEAIAILEKHKYNLPLISNNKGTEKLKKALRILGLRRKVRISTHRTDGEVIDEWKELCEVISWHKSRKTAITILLSNGVAISLVMQISGHKKEATLSRYKDFSDKVLIEAMKNMRPNKRGAI